MIKAKVSLTIVVLMLIAQPSFAVVVLGTQLGFELGRPLGALLGTALPFSLGGAAVIAAVSLIIGTQLIKRKK